MSHSQLQYLSSAARAYRCAFDVELTPCRRLAIHELRMEAKKQGCQLSYAQAKGLLMKH